VLACAQSEEPPVGNWPPVGALERVSGYEFTKFTVVPVVPTFNSFGIDEWRVAGGEWRGGWFPFFL
jgi:hypothetical protein